MLDLGSIGLISELCYKGTILQRNYRKMTILLCKISMVKTFGSPNITVISKSILLQKSFIKGWHFTPIIMVNRKSSRLKTGSNTFSKCPSHLREPVFS